MKRTVFALMITLVVFLTGPVQKMRAASCSNATLSNNTYMWLESYTYPYGGAYAGMVTFLSNGTWDAAVTGGVKGAISQYDISGTYSVSSNCTVTLTWQSGFPAVGVIVSSGNEVFLNTGESGNTCFILLESLGPMDCSAATLYKAGNYGVASESWYPALGNDTGYLSFTNTGSVSGVLTGSTTGTPGEYIVSGTYTVSDSCVLTLNFTSGSDWEGAVQSTGNQAFLTNSNMTGNNFTIVLTRE